MAFFFFFFFANVAPHENLNGFLLLIVRLNMSSDAIDRLASKPFHQLKAICVGLEGQLPDMNNSMPESGGGPFDESSSKMQSREDPSSLLGKSLQQQQLLAIKQVQKQNAGQRISSPEGSVNFSLFFFFF